MITFVASAALLFSSCAFPLNANASQSLDVNNDGAINMVDAMYINRFLAGLNDVSDLSRLDVTGDYVVDMMDVACITARLTGATFSWGYVTT